MKDQPWWGRSGSPGAGRLFLRTVKTDFTSLMGNLYMRQWCSVTIPSRIRTRGWDKSSCLYVQNRGSVRGGTGDRNPGKYLFNRLYYYHFIVPSFITAKDYSNWWSLTRFMNQWCVVERVSVGLNAYLFDLSWFTVKDFSYHWSAVTWYYEVSECQPPVRRSFKPPDHNVPHDTAESQVTSLSINMKTYPL